jgi:hypothetical protein
MKPVLILAAIGLVLFVAFRGLFGGGTESWHQRLTLVVETPEGEVHGSAVTSVKVVEYSGELVLPEARGPRATVTGEAVAVEVLPGRWLFALLDGSEGKYRSAKGWVYAAYPHEEQKTGSVRMHDLVIGAVRSQPLDAPVELPGDSWPMLVTFDDITKPETVREVDPDDLAAVFGEGVRVKAVTLEITREAVTEGRVEAVLGWLCDYSNPYRRLSGMSGAIFDNELSNNLGPGNFLIGDCP